MNTSLNLTSGALLMSEEQAASALSVSVRTLQSWRVSGRGPVFSKIGRCVRYRQSDLEVFVEKGLSRSTTEADAKKAVAQ